MIPTALCFYTQSAPYPTRTFRNRVNGRPGKASNPTAALLVGSKHHDAREHARSGDDNLCGLNLPLGTPPEGCPSGALANELFRLTALPPIGSITVAPLLNRYVVYPAK